MHRKRKREAFPVSPKKKTISQRGAERAIIPLRCLRSLNGQAFAESVCRGKDTHRAEDELAGEIAGLVFKTC